MAVLSVAADRSRCLHGNRRENTSLRSFTLPFALVYYFFSVSAIISAGRLARFQLTPLQHRFHLRFGEANLGRAPMRKIACDNSLSTYNREIPPSNRERERETANNTLYRSARSLVKRIYPKHDERKRDRRTNRPG